jgi:DNA polymerase III sliding clamp (beta) subunit (PCNA family)
MLNITIRSPKELLRILKGIGGIKTEVNFDFSPRGIEAIGIDDGRIGLFKLFLSADDFHTYEIDCPSYRIGLNLDDVSDMLSLVTDKDILYINYIPGDSYKITFVVKRPKNKQIITIPIIEVGDKTFEIESLEKVKYLSSGFIDLADLIYAIKMADKISETMEISASSIGLTLKTEGMKADWLQNFPDNITQFDSKEIINNTYALSYLKSLTTIANPKKALVKFSMTTYAPIKCEIDLFGHKRRRKRRFR